MGFTYTLIVHTSAALRRKGVNKALHRHVEVGGARKTNPSRLGARQQQQQTVDQSKTQSLLGATHTHVEHEYHIHVHVFAFNKRSVVQRV